MSDLQHSKPALRSSKTSSSKAISMILRRHRDWIHKWAKTLKKELFNDELHPMSKMHIIRVLHGFR
jgi:hypothetical protein